MWFHWQLAYSPVIWCGKLGGVPKVGFRPLMYSYQEMGLIDQSPFQVNTKFLDHTAQLAA